GGQHDRSGGGRFDVGVGQPGVQREQRNLDREGNEEGEEQENLGLPGEADASAAESLEQRRVVEASANVIEIDHRAQHQNAAGHRVEEELHRGVDAPVVAPHSDEEVHGDKRNFPEHIEEEQIQRHEYANDTKFEQQQERVEERRLFLDVVPGDEHRD